MEVGSGRRARTPGDRRGGTVGAMTYGHRTGYVGDPVADRVVPLPEDLDPLLGIYVAHMGPICANGLLHAAARPVRARRPLARRRGARPARRGGRRRGGGPAHRPVRPAARRRLGGGARPDPAAPGGRRGAGPGDPRPGRPTTRPWCLKTRWRHGAGRPGRRRGVPVPGPGLRRCTWRCALLRPQGTVIDLAFYQGGADAVRLGEEFHHNGLALRCAQIGRVPRGLAHTWDRERLSAETIDLLRADGDLIRKHLISAVVPFEEAPDAPRRPGRAAPAGTPGHPHPLTTPHARPRPAAARPPRPPASPRRACAPVIKRFTSWWNGILDVNLLITAGEGAAGGGGQARKRRVRSVGRPPSSG